MYVYIYRYMYTNIYKYMYTCMYTCIHIYICTHIYVYVCPLCNEHKYCSKTDLSACVRMFVFVCVYTRACVGVRVCVCVCVRVRVPSYKSARRETPSLWNTSQRFVTLLMICSKSCIRYRFVTEYTNVRHLRCEIQARGS